MVAVQVEAWSVTPQGCPHYIFYSVIYLKSRGKETREDGESRLCPVLDFPEFHFPIHSPNGPWDQVWTRSRKPGTPSWFPTWYRFALPLLPSQEQWGSTTLLLYGSPLSQVGFNPLRHDSGSCSLATKNKSWKDLITLLKLLDLLSLYKKYWP